MEHISTIINRVYKNLEERSKTMSDYDNNMSGVLFKNNKEGIEARPDYTGKCEINGVEYWISSWIKTGKQSGKQFLSLSFQAKEETQDYGKPTPQHEDDSVPF